MKSVTQLQFCQEDLFFKFRRGTEATGDGIGSGRGTQPRKAAEAHDSGTGPMFPTPVERLEKLAESLFLVSPFSFFHERSGRSGGGILSCRGLEAGVANLPLAFSVL